MKLHGRTALIMKMKPDTMQMRIKKTSWDSGWILFPLNSGTVRVDTPQRQKKQPVLPGQEVAGEAGEAAVCLSSGNLRSRLEIGFLPPGLCSTSSCACLPLLSIKALATYVIPEQC